MKKVIAIAFLAALAVDCSKKNDENKESNIMLDEPKVENAATVVDTANATKPAQEVVAVDSTATK